MIRSLRIKGFRRFEDETVAFGPGTNFVVGENNAGKTSILYAIEYGLFGRVDGFKSLMGLLQPSARGMGVELVFDGRDGATYRLQRIHVLPPRSRSKLTGHFTLKQVEAGTAQAEAAPERYLLSSDFQDHEEALSLKLQELLGVTRRLFQVAVHMRQGEIARILEGAPELDIVLGVTAAVIASDELRGNALELEKEAAALPILEESARHLGEERDRLASTAASAEAEVVALQGQVTALWEAVGRAKAADGARRPLVDAYDALVRAEQAARDAEARQADHAERVAAVLAKGSRDDVIGRMGDAEARSGATVEAREALGAERSAAEDERRGLDRTRGDLAGRIARRDELPTGADARCEACGAPIDAEHNTRELAAWTEELGRVDARLAALAASLDGSRDRARGLDREEKDLAVVLADGKRQLADLDELDERGADRARAVAEAESALVERARDARAAAAAWTAGQGAGEAIELPDGPGDEGAEGAGEAARDEGWGGVRSGGARDEGAGWGGVRSGGARDEGAGRGGIRTGEAASARALRTALGPALEALGRRLGERLGRAEADRDAASERLTRAEDDRRGWITRSNEVERELAGVNARLGDLRAKARRAERLRKLSAGFKDLQGELREQASVALAADAHLLHGALSAGDDHPAEFDRLVVDPAKYSVQVVPRHLGQEVPAALYEGGGHRLLLGLAFKLAVARLVGKVPFVLLDEPTYGLDDRHRGNLLDRIADLGVSEQILLITHESMGRSGGRLVRVARDGDKSRVSAPEVA